MTVCATRIVTLRFGRDVAHTGSVTVKLPGPDRARVHCKPEPGHGTHGLSTILSVRSGRFWARSVRARDAVRIRRDRLSRFQLTDPRPAKS